MRYRLPKCLLRSFKVLVFFLLLACFLPASADAYPSAEVLGAGSVNPPFDLGTTSSYSGFLLISDGRMAISYGETVKLVDLGRYALESGQPPVLSADDDTDGVIGGIAYLSGPSKIVASQADGDILYYDLNNITAKPVSVTISENSKLGPIVINSQASSAYIANNTTRAIHTVNLSDQTVSNTAMLTIAGATNFTITDAVYVTATSEVYFTTTAGRVFYMGEGGTTATRIDVDATGAKSLSAVAAFPSGEYIYVVDSTTPALVKISTSSHAVVKNDIDISKNPDPDDIAITNVTNPNGTYAFVCGTAAPSGGVSVVDTATDEVFDLGTDSGVDKEPLPVSATPTVLAGSSSADGIVYMGFSTGKLGILTANPFVTISGVTFSDGGTSLKEAISMTVTFGSTKDGTYTVKSGGTVAGSGTTLTDSSGSASGSVTANTDTAVIINHDDNSSAFSEGTNNIYVFATSSSGTGRRATQVTVDTPPPNVVIRSSNFGNGRVYMTFDRVDESDMSAYNIYVDADPDAVLTKTDASGTPSQGSSGSTQTADVGGLTNGVIYYVAMEAVDAAGNKSPARTSTFPDGSRVTATPEETVGPAGILGESGCAVTAGAGPGAAGAFMCLAMAIILYVARFRFRRSK